MYALIAAIIDGSFPILEICGELIEDLEAEDGTKTEEISLGHDTPL